MKKRGEHQVTSGTPKRNGFGELYAQSADELQQEIERVTMTTSNVYATNLSSPEDKFGFTVEIADNITGDTICYAEAPTEEALRQMLRDIDVEQP